MYDIYHLSRKTWSASSIPDFLWIDDASYEKYHIQASRGENMPRPAHHNNVDR